MQHYGCVMRKSTLWAALCFSLHTEGKVQSNEIPKSTSKVNRDRLYNLAQILESANRVRKTQRPSCYYARDRATVYVTDSEITCYVTVGTLPPLRAYPAAFAAFAVGCRERSLATFIGQTIKTRGKSSVL